MKIKQQSIVFLMLLTFSFALAGISMIYQPPAVNNTSLKPELRTSDTTWYESNEDYNIGDFPDNEWESTFPSRVQVVQALEGKAIRLKTTSSGSAAYMDRFGSFPISSGQSLYLSFKVQVNKIAYADSEATIEVIGTNSQYFFKIEFSTMYSRIDIRVAGGQLMQFWDFVPGQAYYFDIIFRNDPETNLMKYLIFINQKLEFTTEVNTALYPYYMDMNLVVPYGGSAELFMDNFFMGYVESDVSEEYQTTIAYPMYYLFAPEYFNDPYDYIEEVNLKFSYLEEQSTTVTYALTVGGSVVDVLSCSVPIPLSEYVEFYSSEEYEVSTNEDNLIIFTRVEGDVRDITIELPGVHPDADTSEMCGYYSFDFISSRIKSLSESFFLNEFGSLPNDFEDCKNQVLMKKTIICASEGGNQGNYEKIDEYLYETSNSYEIGLGIGIDLGKYLDFDFGITYTSEYSYSLRSNVKIEVQWEHNPPEGEMAQFYVYAPSEEIYPSSFYFPPYSVVQVNAKVRGLTASGGNRRVTLNWNAISGTFFSHYNIYRLISGSYHKIDTSTVNSYTHTGLGYSTTYTYKVSAVIEIDGEYYETSKSASASATTKPYGGGGGGCPFLNVFDGVEFIEEGLLDIHDPGGSDLIYEHTLITQPARIENRYLLRLIEHPLTISHIDKVELYGQLSNGRMIRLPLISAIHSVDGQVRFLLWFSDDRKVIELGAIHNDGISQMIDLEFYAPSWINFKNFVFVIEGNNYLVK